MLVEDTQLYKFILDSGLVTKEDLEEARADADKKGKRLGSTLVTAGKITADNLRRMEAYVLGIPFVDLKGKKIGVIARGSSTETGMRYLFAKAGLNPDDATYVAVGGAVTAYNALQSKHWDVHLYGTYETPIPPFQRAFQPTLDKAYRAARPDPLPFEFGYNFSDKRDNRSNVLVGRRVPAEAAPLPVAAQTTEVADPVSTVHKRNPRIPARR